MGDIALDQKYVWLITYDTIIKHFHDPFLITFSRSDSVTVSLVRIKGTDCKAVELGQVSNKTGGQVPYVY